MPAFPLGSLPRALVGAVLVVVAAGCGSSSEDSASSDPAPATPGSESPEPESPSPTNDGNGAPEGEEEATLENGTTDDVNGLRLGVSVYDGEGRVEVSQNPGDDSGPDVTSQQVSGEPGHSETLDNGYTVTIVDVADPPYDPGDGDQGPPGGSVTVRVEAPD
ncbi:hypothetical protein [Lipingzhangella halophila]|nr:hypothetical protein [Lipingzhangella halophila]